MIFVYGPPCKKKFTQTLKRAFFNTPIFVLLFHFVGVLFTLVKLVANIQIYIQLRTTY